MSKFIETKDGSFVLSSEIAEIQKRERKGCSITTKSGNHYSIAWSANDLAVEIERGLGCAMPAQPGYFVISAAPPMTADGEWHTSRRPVVGWLSIEDPDDRYVFESLSIVASVNGAETAIWAILAPDGTVYRPYGREFESVADWLVSLKTEEDQDFFLSCLSENRKRVRRREI